MLNESLASDKNKAWENPEELGHFKEDYNYCHVHFQ